MTSRRNHRQDSLGHPRHQLQCGVPFPHPIGRQPVLRMLNGDRIVASDLTGIITGASAGPFPTTLYPPNPVYPECQQPFREIVAIYHDEIGAKQSFAAFNDPVLQHTLHPARNGSAINYGAAGAGAEILSSRLGVAPAAACAECKYEEFFLTSWAVGDPAMVVDVCVSQYP